MSEKVISKRYLTYLDYFATGEGHLIEMRLGYATNEKEAIQKHVELSYPTDKPGQDFFARGMRAVEVETNEAEELLTAYFNQSIYEAIVAGASGEGFNFKLHYNVA